MGNGAEGRVFALEVAISIRFYRDTNLYHTSIMPPEAKYPWIHQDRLLVQQRAPLQSRPAGLPGPTITGRKSYLFSVYCLPGLCSHPPRWFQTVFYHLLATSRALTALIARSVCW
jgi:hypothetical protein